MSRKKKKRRAPGPSLVNRAPASFVDAVAGLLDEMEVLAPCSDALAEHFADVVGDFAEELANEAQEARESLDEWPDDPRMREMRDLLAAFAVEADRDAAKWADFGKRLARAGEVMGHLHLVDGKLVDGDEDDVRPVRVSR